MASSVFAQADSSKVSDSTQVDTAQVVPVDTIIYVPTYETHPAARVTNFVNLEEHLNQNPTIALFKSMLVPGWGQFGNKKYVKGAVVVGLQTWFISSAVKYGKQASDAKALFDQANTDSQRLARFYDWDKKRKDRNKYIWFSGIVVFLSMFDAYVDAHLSGSPTDDRNDKFGFEIAPKTNGGVAASVSYNF